MRVKICKDFPARTRGRSGNHQGTVVFPFSLFPVWMRPSGPPALAALRRSPVIPSGAVLRAPAAPRSKWAGERIVAGECSGNEYGISSLVLVDVPALYADVEPGGQSGGRDPRDPQCGDAERIAVDLVSGLRPRPERGFREPAV